MKKIVYVDMDGVLVDFESAFAFLSDDLRHAYDKRLDEIPGIFALMDPLPGALEAYHELAGKFDTYILSTAPWKNPSAWAHKVRWVQAHLGKSAEKRLIISHHKELHIGDFLIDDRVKNGAREFRGMFIHFGQEPFWDWPAVMAFLRAQVTD